jgi:predicted nucleotidyltransferase
METTKNKIPNNIQKIIDKFKKYIDTNIYYYGSIQRQDYFIGNSDIDILIFTDNTEAMIHKVIHYFHLNKRKISKIVWNYKSKLIQGNKVVYYSNNPVFRLEIAIYDEKYKHDVLQDKNLPNNMSYFISLLLIFLKILHYNLKMIPQSFYSYYKNAIFNFIRGETVTFTHIDNF